MIYRFRIRTNDNNIRCTHIRSRKLGGHTISTLFMCMPAIKATHYYHDDGHDIDKRHYYYYALPDH